MIGYAVMLNIHGVYCTEFRLDGVTFMWDKALKLYKRGLNERRRFDSGYES